MALLSSLAAFLVLAADPPPRTCAAEDVACAATFDPLRKELRGLLTHKRNAPPVGPFAHIDIEALYADPANEAYLEGRRPFVLTGAMAKWTAPTRWRNGRALSRWFGKEIVDFYPMNMLRSGGGNNPYLFEFAPALHELKKKVGRGRFGQKEYDDAWEAGNAPGKYLHLQLKEEQWAKLRRNGLGSKDQRLHIWLRTDGWMKRCLPTQALRDEYHIKTHWKIVLIGTPGAGMFNHSDSLLTSSWHAHVQGRKWWYVCGTGDGPGPYEGEHRCFEDALEVGEILYYPKDYHHETQNLKMPTMTVTGTVVNKHNYADIATMLHQVSRSLKFYRYSFRANLLITIYFDLTISPNNSRSARRIFSPSSSLARSVTRWTSATCTGTRASGGWPTRRRQGARRARAGQSGDPSHRKRCKRSATRLMRWGTTMMGVTSSRAGHGEYSILPRGTSSTVPVRQSTSCTDQRSQTFDQLNVAVL